MVKVGKTEGKLYRCEKKGERREKGDQKSALSPGSEQLSRGRTSLALTDRIPSNFGVEVDQAGEQPCLNTHSWKKGSIDGSQ